jgi:glycerol 3-phosphatase-1
MVLWYLFPSLNFCILFHGLQINSIAGIEGAWQSFSDTYPGLNVPEILARKLYLCLLSTLCLYYSTEAHGIRTADSLRRYCGLEDPKVLEKEAARFEMEIINASKKEGRPGIVPIPGAKEAVHVLEVIAGTTTFCSTS